MRPHCRINQPSGVAGDKENHAQAGDQENAGQYQSHGKLLLIKGAGGNHGLETKPGLRQGNADKKGAVVPLSHGFHGKGNLCRERVLFAGGMGEKRAELLLVKAQVQREIFRKGIGDKGTVLQKGFGVDKHGQMSG